MKEEQDKWCKALRDHMKDYAEPVPEEVWESLEKELILSSHSRNKFSLWRLVAAVALITLLSSVTFYLLLSPADEYIRVNSNVITQELYPQKDEIPEVNPVIVKEEKISLVKPAFPSLISFSEKKKEEISLLPLEGEEREAFENKISEDDPEEERIIEKEESIFFNTYPENNTSYGKRSTTLRYASARKNVNKLGGSLLVGNIPAISSNFSVPGASILYKAPSNIQEENCSYVDDFIDMNLESSNNTCLTTDEGIRQSVLRNAAKERTETNIKHKMPVTVGFAFRYRVSEQFALETGVLYTYLSSEMTSGSNSNYYIDTYKYHYLGIPLKANWTFWNKKYYSFYASGGGMIEKSVSGKEVSKNFLDGEMMTNKTHSHNIKPLQFSLSAALGVQLNLTEHLGLYVEPGIIHYFDDGSEIETIRKDKPTNFNLQVGLRFNY